MIDAVLLFGFINIVFEMVLLSMLPVKFRLKLLGTHEWQLVLHMMFLVGNLLIHWGTLIGTMSSILAFCASIVSVRIAQTLFGKIEGGRFYTVGLLKYSAKELS